MGIEGGLTINNYFNISSPDGEGVRRLIPQIAYELQRHMRTQGAVGMIA
jgi:hypothetical protein